MRTKHTTQTRQCICPAEQQIRYWMRSPAITQNLEVPLSEALICMHEHNVRRLPVVLDTRELCGIITQGDIRSADLLYAAGLDPQMVAEATRLHSALPSLRPRLCDPLSCALVGIRQAVSAQQRAVAGAMPV